MSDALILLAGTKKGLFFWTTNDRKVWVMRGPFLPGKDINHAVWDGRTRRIYATSNDSWFGSEIVWSEDLGQTWVSSKRGPGFAEDSGLKLDRIWHIEPGPATQPGMLLAGVAPAALFRSLDDGGTWEEVTGLSRHPTRDRWHPGAGGLCLHSIVIDREVPDRWYVGISAVGVFRTDDAGGTWKPVNRGTRAEFMPDKYPEFGQCVHKLLASRARPSVIFQQNHCGVYRSEDAGESWREFTAGLPSDFGFPLAIHPREAETIFVLPLKGGEFRCPPGGSLRVFRSRNGGADWEALTRGLPQQDAYMGVLREGMAADALDPAGVYFGTTSGKIFGSSNEGDDWFLLADNLPSVVSIFVSAL